MNVLTNPVVVGALVALGLAWVGVLSALAAYALARIQRAERDLNGVGAKADATARAVGGGPGAVGAPVWLQEADLLPNGQRASLWGSECGEECVSMAVMSIHGVPTIADGLRVLLRGPQGGALTGPADIVDLLALCNVRGVARAVPVDNLPGVVQQAAQRGRFVIALGYWVSPSFLHWALVHNASGNGWSANDPIRGMVNDAWGWVGPRYAGKLVEVTQGRDGTPA